MPAMTFSGFLARDSCVCELPLQVGDLLFELRVFFFEARAVDGDIELHRERPSLKRERDIARVSRSRRASRR